MSIRVYIVTLYDAKNGVLVDATVDNTTVRTSDEAMRFAESKYPVRFAAIKCVRA